MNKGLSELGPYLFHLTSEQCTDITKLIQAYCVLFNNVPTCTKLLEQDIDVGYYCYTLIKMHTE